MSDSEAGPIVLDRTSLGVVFLYKLLLKISHRRVFATKTLLVDIEEGFNSNEKFIIIQKLYM